MLALCDLQTSPAHILGQLDKSLREASTLDGVLEFRHEHFWTLSFGRLVRLTFVFLLVQILACISNSNFTWVAMPFSTKPTNKHATHFKLKRVMV